MSYETHDRTGDERYQDEQYENQRIWKVAGGVLVVAIALYVLQPKERNSSPLVDRYVHEHGLKTEPENREAFKDA